MSTQPIPPGDCDCCRGMARRTFLKSTTTGVAVAATGSLSTLAAEHLKRQETRKATSETLVTTLFKSLSEEQHKAICFPFDHPLRSKVDNNWHITDKNISQSLTQDQQAMVREIFLKLHSPDYAQNVFQQVEQDAGKGGFGSCSI